MGRRSFRARLRAAWRDTRVSSGCVQTQFRAPTGTPCVVGSRRRGTVHTGTRALSDAIRCEKGRTSPACAISKHTDRRVYAYRTTLHPAVVDAARRALGVCCVTWHCDAFRIWLMTERALVVFYTSCGRLARKPRLAFRAWLGSPASRRRVIIGTTR